MARQYRGPQPAPMLWYQSNFVLNTNIGTDQPLVNFFGNPIGDGRSGLWIPTYIVCTPSDIPSAGTTGGIFDAATGGGHAIVSSFNWNTTITANPQVLPINSAVTPAPYVGGGAILLSAVPRLFMSVPSSNSVNLSIWIYGYDFSQTY